MGKRYRKEGKANTRGLGEFRAFRTHGNPEISLYPQLASELFRALGDIRFVGLWAEETRGEYVLHHISLSQDRYKRVVDFLNSEVRNQLGLRPLLLQSSRESAHLVRGGPKANQWYRIQFPLPVRKELFFPKWGLVLTGPGLKLQGTSRRLLVEIYTGRKSTLNLSDLKRDICAFCNSYFESKKMVTNVAKSHHRLVPGHNQLVPIDAWSPSLMQSTLDVKLRSRIHSAVVGDTHLFFVDPSDEMLYFASTDHLRIRKEQLDIASFPWRLPRLSDKKMQYVRERLCTLQKDLRISDDLMGLYDRLVGGGLRRRELERNEDALRAILRCLPQELQTGIAGDAVITRQLQIGGFEGQIEPRWDLETLQQGDRFFAQKLALERLFATAMTGFLTAVPLFDGPQATGALFMTTVGPSDASDRDSLLEIAYEASTFVAEFRAYSFERNVLRSVKDAPTRPLAEVIAEHFSNILLHRLLLVRTPDRIFKTGWWIAPYDICRSRIRGSFNFRSLTHVYEETIKAGGLMPFPRSKVNGLMLGRWLDNVRTALVIPIQNDISFLILLDDAPESITMATEKWRRISAVLKSLFLLPDIYKSALEYEKARQRGLDSSHRMKERFAIPLDNFLNDLRELEKSNEISESVRAKLQRLSGRLLFHKERMEEQIYLLDPAKTVEMANVDLHVILSDHLVRRFEEMLISCEERENLPYRERIKLDTSQITFPLFVKGDEKELGVGFWGVLENTLRNYAISPGLIRSSQDTLIVSVSGHGKNGWVTIVIEDCGHGIDPHVASALNKELEQIGHGGFKKACAGLGLAQIAGVVGRIAGEDGARGSVTIAPRELDRGTTVTVRIPAPIEYGIKSGKT